MSIIGISTKHVYTLYSFYLFIFVFHEVHILIFRVGYFLAGSAPAVLRNQSPVFCGVGFFSIRIRSEKKFSALDPIRLRSETKI